MSRAEKFIQEYTRNCSNELSEVTNTICGKMKVVNGYQPWLTPDQARRAVEIAREEIYEWLKEHLEEYVYYWMDEEFRKDDLINDLKQAMKDE